MFVKYRNLQKNLADNQANAAACVFSQAERQYEDRALYERATQKVLAIPIVAAWYSQTLEEKLRR